MRRSGENRQAPGRDTFHHGVHGRGHETQSRHGAHLPRGSPEGFHRGYHSITPSPTSGIRADGQFLRLSGPGDPPLSGFWHEAGHQWSAGKTQLLPCQVHPS